jgi:hypothetical protein
MTEVVVSRPESTVAQSPVTAGNPPAAPTAAATSASAIQSALGRYASAYSRLDAGGAKTVWPNVNERALARTSSSLETQQLDLGPCQFNVTPPSAVASCDGTIRYLAKAGGRSLRSERRHWTFQLTQRVGDWAIESVQFR